MARPKKQTKKQNLMLTVSPQVRAKLTFISEHYDESISALVSAWAEEEFKSICERTEKDPLEITNKTTTTR